MNQVIEKRVRLFPKWKLLETSKFRDSKDKQDPLLVRQILSPTKQNEEIL